MEDEEEQAARVRGAFALFGCIFPNIHARSRSRSRPSCDPQILAFHNHAPRQQPRPPNERGKALQGGPEPLRESCAQSWPQGGGPNPQKVPRPRRWVDVISEAAQSRNRFAETLCMKGLILTHMGRREEGIELVKKGMRFDLTSHICWHVFGLIQKGEKNYEEALKSYTQALRFDKVHNKFCHPRHLFTARVTGESEHLEGLGAPTDTTTAIRWPGGHTAYTPPIATDLASKLDWSRSRIPSQRQPGRSTKSSGAVRDGPEGAQ